MKTTCKITHKVYRTETTFIWLAGWLAEKLEFVLEVSFGRDEGICAAKGQKPGAKYPSLSKIVFETLPGSPRIITCARRQKSTVLVRHNYVRHET